MLYYKKFIEDYKVVGRTIIYPTVLQNMDELKKPGYKYRAFTSLTLNDRYDKISTFKTANFTIYSNNDNWLSLKNGVEYKINGKIDELNMDDFGSITYTILEP